MTKNEVYMMHVIKKMLRMMTVEQQKKVARHTSGLDVWNKKSKDGFYPGPRNSEYIIIEDDGYEWGYTTIKSKKKATEHARKSTQNLIAFKGYEVKL